MTWNYRMIIRGPDDNSAYQIHEVFYDRRGKIEGWTADPVAPCGEDPEELSKDLELMAKALAKPPLSEVYIRGKQKLREVR